jgi:hypothetical protein
MLGLKNDAVRQERGRSSRDQPLPSARLNGGQFNLPDPDYADANLFTLNRIGPPLLMHDLYDRHYPNEPERNCRPFTRQTAPKIRLKQLQMG